MAKKNSTAKDTELSLSFFGKVAALFRSETVHFVIGLVLVIFSVYLLLAFSSFFFTGAADQSIIDGGSAQELISTNNGVKNCKAVDYAAERDRYKNEYFASEEAQILQEHLDMGEKAQKGEITWREYFHYLFPDYTDEQIQSQLGMSYEEYGKLWK